MERRGRARLVLRAMPALLLVAGDLGARVLPVAGAIRRLGEETARMGAGGLVLYGLAYVLAALLFVPGSLLTLAAGLAFGFARGFLVSWLSATAAATVAFLAARRAARSRVQAFASRHPRFGALDRAVGTGGGRVVALLRLSPLVPFSASNYLFGLTPVRLGPYVLATAAGMIPGGALYAALGAAGRAVGSGRPRSAGEWALLAVGLAATAAVTLILARAARRELKKAATSDGAA